MSVPNLDAGDLAQAALAYAAQGLEVFPCDPTDKAPLVEHGNKDATTDPARIAAWWRRWPNALIAARVPVDVVILDIDPRHNGDQVWAALEEHYGPVATGRWHLSGRGDGGRHLWFRRPEGRLSVRALNQWAERERLGDKAGRLSWTAGIDLLHHNHRYTILPPSPHPETGLPYRWGEEGEPGDMAGWLAHLLTTEPERPRPPRQLRPADDNSIADWFSASTSWHDILPQAGWQLVGGDGDTNGSKWRHPNATARHSATVRHGCLFVYSGNTDFSPTEEGDPHGYTRFRAWALLAHDGDMSVAYWAAKERRDGGELGPVDHSFVDAISAPQKPAGAPQSEPGSNGRTDQHEPPQGDRKARVADQPWPDLIPLIDVPELPEFPTHTLPAWIGEHAIQVATDLQVAIDLPAILGLGALSVATLGRAEVRYPRQRWTQPLNLFAAVALPPSAGKSPAKSAMFGPLEEWETQRMAEAKMAKLRAASEVRILKKRLDDLESSAARTGDTEMMRQAAAVALELEVAETLRSGRLMADDATTEALGMVLIDAGGQIAVVSAEGGLFDKLAGMYSDKGANLDLYLEGWSGGRYVVDRVKRDSILVPHANVAVVTTVQPTVLDAIGARKEFAGRGLTARFLLAMPTSNVGYRDRRRVVVGDDRAEQVYAAELVGLAKLLADRKRALIVADEAADLYAEWDQGLEDQLRPMGGLVHLPEWVGKLRANMLRVAALLHLARGFPDDGIGIDTIEAAIEIGEYFVWHARAIAERWGTSSEVSQAREIAEWLQRERLTEFTARDVYRALRRLFPRAEEAVPALDLLTERGWIRPLFPGQLALGRGNRPVPFAVNPALSVLSPLSGLSPLSPLSPLSQEGGSPVLSPLSAVPRMGGQKEAESDSAVHLYKRGFLPLSIYRNEGSLAPPRLGTADSGDSRISAPDDGRGVEPSERATGDPAARPDEF